MMCRRCAGRHSRSQLSVFGVSGFFGTSPFVFFDLLVPLVVPVAVTSLAAFVVKVSSNDWAVYTNK